MPRITPAPMEEGIEVPSISMTSGVSIKGSPFEYLLTDLNLVRQPGEMFPPIYFPVLSRKSIVMVVPMSNTVHGCPLKRYLAAIMDAALSGVIHAGKPCPVMISVCFPDSTSNREHSFSRISMSLAEISLTVDITMISGFTLDVRERMKSTVLSPWYLNVFPRTVPSVHAALRAVFPMSITRLAIAVSFMTIFSILHMLRICCPLSLRLS